MKTEYYIFYKIGGERKQHPHTDTKKDLYFIIGCLLKDGATEIKIEAVKPPTGQKNLNGYKFI